MKLAVIKDVVTSKVGRQLLHVQKHSPVLLLGVGIVGVAATVVLASRATLKAQEVLEEHAVWAEKLNGMKDDPTYDEDTYTKDRVVLYAHTTSKLIKLYSPSVIVGLASVSFLITGHQIQARRNAALMAAYSGLEKAFEKYRKRVLDDLGEDKDREYRYGTVTGEYVERDKEGNEVSRTPGVKVDPGEPSGYAKFFDENSTSWNRESMYNFLFLKTNQSYLNDKLRSKGHVFLNEVYDALGLDRTKAGQVVGWIWQGDGDNYIDFGIFDNEMEPKHLDFFSGRENAILLDFNVDGVIYDKI